MELQLRASFQQGGLNEAVNSTFLPPDFADRLRLPEGHPDRKAPVLMNPTADDQKVMRPSLLPSLLIDAQMNFNRQQDPVHLFEIDKVFHGCTTGAPEERMQACALMAGSAPASTWDQARRKTDFFDIKGQAERVISALGLKKVSWVFSNECLPYQPSMSFRVLDASGEILLKGGSVDPKVLKAYELDGIPCFAIEADLIRLASTPHRETAFSPLPKFPSSWRDLALVVPETVSHEQVTDVLRSEGGVELRDLTLFDLYRGPHVPEGHRSLAYRLNFRNNERTMTDEEVSGKIALILATLKKRFSIAPR